MPEESSGGFDWSQFMGSGGGGGGEGGGGGMSGGGYDISQSTSESATTASSAGSGAFSVGGGLKVPDWLWIVLAVVGLVWAVKKIKG